MISFQANFAMTPEVAQLLELEKEDIRRWLASVAHQDISVVFTLRKDRQGFNVVVGGADDAKTLYLSQLLTIGSETDAASDS